MSLEIANTIKNQLGAKTLFMLGAKNLGGGSNYLSFRIKGSKKANYIKISLNSLDTYDMELGIIRGLNYKITKLRTQLFAEDLHEAIQNETGLAAFMPNVVFN